MRGNFQVEYFRVPSIHYRTRENRTPRHPNSETFWAVTTTNCEWVGTSTVIWQWEYMDFLGVPGIVQNHGI